MPLVTLTVRKPKSSERNGDFVLIAILWSAGRSVKVKRKLLDELMPTLAGAGIDPENVMVALRKRRGRAGLSAAVDCCTPE